jgi:hypothetical protein
MHWHLTNLSHIKGSICASASPPAPSFPHIGISPLHIKESICVHASLHVHLHSFLSTPMLTNLSVSREASVRLLPLLLIPFSPLASHQSLHTKGSIHAHASLCGHLHPPNTICIQESIHAIASPPFYTNPPICKEAYVDLLPLLPHWSHFPLPNLPVSVYLRKR